MILALVSIGTGLVLCYLVYGCFVWRDAAQPYLKLILIWGLLFVVDHKRFVEVFDAQPALRDRKILNMEREAGLIPEAEVAKGSAWIMPQLPREADRHVPPAWLAGLPEDGDGFPYDGRAPGMTWPKRIKTKLHFRLDGGGS